ncbi:MAG: hypothetical protein AAGF31_02040 [Planctomycetota bacterium]
MRSIAITLTALLLCLAAANQAIAQRGGGAGEEPAPDQGTWFESPDYPESGYNPSSYEQPTPLQIIQQKAQRRAMARIRRIETMNAYGMSNSRPTANAAPLTGMYSPAWQMPGGRPYAWFTNRAPQYIFWR